MPQTGTQGFKNRECGQMVDKWFKILRMWINGGQSSLFDKLWINFLRRGKMDKMWTNFRRRGICPLFVQCYNCGVVIQHQSLLPSRFDYL